MVTAGVFLMAKCWIFVEYSIFLQQMITYIGATTAIFAATVALVQTDIKKIIAYSTCSQLGYMFFAIGVLVPTAGIFHLVTHAFFKALLFLGAGSVIHACHHEQNIFKMGGLAKKIPITFAMFMIGSIAIAGIYPLSGYFSKDAILEAAFASHSNHGNYAFLLGIVSAFLTSFYSWRLIILVFHGKYRGDSHHHPHESPIIMLIPLFVLAFFAIITGLIGNNLHILSTEFWYGAIYVSQDILEKMHHLPYLIKYLPSIISLLAIFLAYVLYIKFPNFIAKISQKMKYLRLLFEKKYYFDELYTRIIVKPLFTLSKFLINVFEKVLDAILPHGFVSFVKICANGICRIQSGIVFIYFLVFFAFISLIFQYYSFINSKGLIYYTIIWLKNLFN
jgi:NADH-quinone oxidoreductase subunit L